MTITELTWKSMRKELSENCGNFVKVLTCEVSKIITHYQWKKRPLPVRSPLQGGAAEAVDNPAP